MTLLDCEKCWDTPCRCGHQYKSWPLESLLEFRAMIERVISEKMRARPHKS